MRSKYDQKFDYLHYHIARSLLARVAAENDISLAEIANACGFCDQPAFTRAFNKAERISPAAWRRNRR